jgi:NAD(P)-dependent dehydrogenase (short-subunit alcohol dehydrogenase family)
MYVEDSMRLAERVALVTGAGTGIGAAIAHRFAAEGAAVCLAGHHRENVERVTNDIVQTGGRAIACRVDVSDSAAIASAIQRTSDTFGPLDIMVANAALAGTNAYLGTLTEITDQQWQRIIDVNLSGVFYSAREAARVMIPRQSGCIITIGSVNSFVPEDDVTAYAASKGGVLLLTRSLARDLGKFGIRVNGIAPGGTDTENILSAIDKMGLSPDQLTKRIPIGRRAKSEEIAAAALFLASDDASFVHGVMMPVDGGQLCT